VIPSPLASPSWIPAFPQFPGIIAGFTTRLGGFSQSPFQERNLGFFSGDEEASVVRNWRLTLRETGLENHRLVLPRMVHGIKAVEVDSQDRLSSDASMARGDWEYDSPQDCDAVFTLEKNYALAMTMADCTPLLLHDPVTGCIGAIHAGWRGTRDGILAKTLDRLFREGKAKPQSTWLCLGPALCASHLELGADVIAKLDAHFVVDIPARNFHTDLNSEAAIHTRKKGLDMAKWLLNQAIDAQVPASQVRHLGHCTFEQAESFFSYRRDGARSGRMAALIGHRLAE
jgi:YfiH family protein